MILSAFRMTAARPIASSPTRLRAKAAADHDALGAGPRLELEKAADHQRQLLREILDRALHHAGGFGVALGRASRRASSCSARRVGVSPNGSSPALRSGLRQFSMMSRERALAGAVAEEALVVLQLDIVAVDLDRRQARARHARRRSGKVLLFGHDRALQRATNDGTARKVPARSSRDPLHDVDRAAQQRLRGFERAEGGVRGQRHIVHPRERVVGLQRLGMEHVEPGMADMAAAQRRRAAPPRRPARRARC